MTATPPPMRWLVVTYHWSFTQLPLEHVAPQQSFQLEAHSMSI